MPSAGFEPAIPAIERKQTYALDRAATGIGAFSLLGPNIFLVTLFPNTVHFIKNHDCSRN
jgi:hypothetical protein